MGLNVFCRNHICNTYIHTYMYISLSIGTVFTRPTTTWKALHPVIVENLWTGDAPDSPYATSPLNCSFFRLVLEAWILLRLVSLHCVSFFFLALFLFFCLILLDFSTSSFCFSWSLFLYGLKVKISRPSPLLFLVSLLSTAFGRGEMICVTF